MTGTYRETTNGSHDSGSCSSAAWTAVAITRSRSPWSCRPAPLRSNAWRAAICARRRRSTIRPAAVLRRPPRGGALGTKPLESKRVDRFERQNGLKSLARCRVEIARGLPAPARDRDPRGSAGSRAYGGEWRPPMRQAAAAGGGGGGGFFFFLPTARARCLGRRPSADRAIRAAIARGKEEHNVFGRLPSSSPPGKPAHSCSVTCGGSVGRCLIMSFSLRVGRDRTGHFPRRVRTCFTSHVDLDVGVLPSAPTVQQHCSPLPPSPELSLTCARSQYSPGWPNQASVPACMIVFGSPPLPLRLRCGARASRRRSRPSPARGTSSR